MKEVNHSPVQIKLTQGDWNEEFAEKSVVADYRFMTILSYAICWKGCDKKTSLQLYSL